MSPYYGRCVNCRRAYIRELSTPERARKKHLRLNYRTTPEEIDALLRAQDFCCGVCERQISFSGREGVRRDDAVVDHDHATGRVRGVLCKNCNLGLGLFEDKPDLLRAAASYLERKGTARQPRRTAGGMSINDPEIVSAIGSDERVRAEVDEIIQSAISGNRKPRRSS